MLDKETVGVHIFFIFQVKQVFQFLTSSFDKLDKCQKGCNETSLACNSFVHHHGNIILLIILTAFFFHFVRSVQLMGVFFILVWWKETW